MVSKRRSCMTTRPSTMVRHTSEERGLVDQLRIDIHIVIRPVMQALPADHGQIGLLAH